MQIGVPESGKKKADAKAPLFGIHMRGTNKGEEARAISFPLYKALVKKIGDHVGASRVGVPLFSVVLLLFFVDYFGSFPFSGLFPIVLRLIHMLTCRSVSLVPLSVARPFRGRESSYCRNRLHAYAVPLSHSHSYERSAHERWL